jgi:hypothetical protein
MSPKPCKIAVAFREAIRNLSGFGVTNSLSPDLSPTSDGFGPQVQQLDRSLVQFGWRIGFALRGHA